MADDRIKRLFAESHNHWEYLKALTGAGAALTYAKEAAVAVQDFDAAADFRGFADRVGAVLTAAHERKPTDPLALILTAAAAAKGDV